MLLCEPMRPASQSLVEPGSATGFDWGYIAAVSDHNFFAGSNAAQIAIRTWLDNK